MSSRKSEISVIVPFLNEEGYIERCVNSLLTQNFDPESVELMFVDNNSTDASAAIVSKYPEIKLVRESVPHVYAARNTVIKCAHGAILAFPMGIARFRVTGWLP